MEIRLATMNDLPQLKVMYKKIVEHMYQNNIRIWDEVYPYDCFYDDIEKRRLYVLEDSGAICSAFALCDSNAGTDAIAWQGNSGKSCYIDRFGVNVDDIKKGIGSFALKQAIALAREKGADFLRLFVVDINKPAINLYVKNGFRQAEGIYDEVIDNDIILREYGFEIEIMLQD